MSDGVCVDEGYNRCFLGWGRTKLGFWGSGFSAHVKIGNFIIITSRLLQRSAIAGLPACRTELLSRYESTTSPETRMLV